jgi:hypothetical protein
MQLSHELTSKEVNTLLAYLEDPSTARKKNLWDLSLKNDVITKLLEQTELSKDLGSMLIKVASTPGGDSIWQDYAMQFLAPYAQKKYVTHGHSPDEELEVIANALRKGATNEDPEVVGTSLIGMNRLRTLSIQDGVSISTADVISAAQSVLDNSDSKEAARITAIQMMGQVGNKDFLKNAVVILNSESNHTVMEKMAAVATMADIGEVETLTLLENMSKESSLDKRVLMAANAAIRKLKKKLG